MTILLMSHCTINRKNMHVTIQYYLPSQCTLYSKHNHRFSEQHSCFVVVLHFLYSLLQRFTILQLYVVVVDADHRHLLHNERGGDDRLPLHQPAQRRKSGSETALTGALVPDLDLQYLVNHPDYTQAGCSFDQLRLLLSLIMCFNVFNF